MSASSVTIERVQSLLQELIDYQRARLLKHARQLNPRLTEDDIAQPHDFPELASSPEWNYEDGILAGYLAAQTALRAELQALS